MRESLFITGGSGLLGNNIAKIALSQFQVYASYLLHPSQIPECSFIPLDIRDIENTLSVFRRIKPDLVIHAAALTSVDYCQEYPQEARAINIKGTENIARATGDIKAKLIYISTDSVFDGERGMYKEGDKPRPINIYAETKLEGERAVQRILPDSIIVRTAFYGWSLRDRRSLAEQIIGDLREGKTRQGFTDVFFSPIFTSYLIEVLIEMYRQDLTGIYHVAGSERCSKYHFSQEVARAFGFDTSLIQPVYIAEASLKAPRPRDISLDVSKISAEINTHLPGIKEGIERFKEREPER